MTRRGYDDECDVELSSTSNIILSVDVCRVDSTAIGGGGQRQLGSAVGQLGLRPIHGPRLTTVLVGRRVKRRLSEGHLNSGVGCGCCTVLFEIYS